MPINKALDVLINQLNDGKDDLIETTKLCLKEVFELAELCPSKCYFLWDKKIIILKNPGPIGLSFCPFGCFIQMFCSEFGTQNYSISINFISDSKNI